MYREWISLCCATVFVLLLVACLGIGGGASAAAASRVGRGGATGGAVATDSDQAVLVDGGDHPLAAGLADAGMDAPPIPQAMAG
ncbi:hypothetical protein GJ699_00725 [Duganella sp. FT80W]|uniref:Uncharacterized protein n=1 Tax=Duganella guangzhouensis TaxID=2666084 RepID=A0A6I2KSA4_9BURK|nr:hypothetical protein [Duganella guangzhouensis]MRW88503.1 hypothetical protein [Duganella guangzhouensis]